MEQVIATSVSRVIYGYMKDDTGRVSIDSAQSKIVKMIFDKYLDGFSLGGLRAWLESISIASPTGKAIWTRATLDKMLSNPSYVPLIINQEQYDNVQKEKNRRSNTECIGDQTLRKPVRYNSTNVLSGLLVCAECCANYRRITRHDGSVVWRCANRVEHGKKVCKHSPTVDENTGLELLQRSVGNESLHQSVNMRKAIGAIHISTETGIQAVGY